MATVKIRQCVARKKVLLHVLESLRSQVDGGAWAIIDATLVQRKSAERAATMLGVNEAQIRRVLSSVAYAWLAETYGTESIALFERLLGNKRR